MSADYALTPARSLDLATLAELLADKRRVVLSAEAQQRIAAGNQHARRQAADAQKSVPGAAVSNSSDQLQTAPAELLPPVALLMAQAAGTGEEVPGELVRLMLLLKAQSLSHGHSGVQLATVQRLLDFYNRDILPVVYQQGGDTAALAQLSLPLTGLGEVNYLDYRLQTTDALHLFSWAPLVLEARESQALLSGTQLTLAYGVLAFLRAQRLVSAADAVGALSHDVFGGSQESFAARLHQLRPHSGQVRVAERFRKFLQGSELEPASAAAAPYSFRCQPQVHGAAREALTYVAQVLATECNAVTEELAIFPEDGTELASGNFHGQLPGQALDFLALAVAGLGGISERRTSQLLSGQRGLPPLLAAAPGRPSGFPGLPQTAAGIISQVQQLCAPASAGSLRLNNVEDYVSPSAAAASKALRVVESVEQVVAIELLTAAQALELRRPARTSPALEQVMAAFRAAVPFATQDRMLYPDLHAAAVFLRAHPWP